MRSRDTARIPLTQFNTGVEVNEGLEGIGKHNGWHYIYYTYDFTVKKEKKYHFSANLEAINFMKDDLEMM